MRPSPTVRLSAPHRFTVATLTVGVLLSGLCFVVAVLGEVAGPKSHAPDVTDVVAIVDGIRVMAPWAWATLGSYVVVLTPAMALLVTIAEFASVSERPTVLTALTVFAILVASAIVALTR